MLVSICHAGMCNCAHVILVANDNRGSAIFSTPSFLFVPEAEPSKARHRFAGAPDLITHLLHSAV